MRLSWRDPYQESHNCKSLVVVWFLSMHDTLHRISSLQGEAGMAPPSPGGPREHQGWGMLARAQSCPVVPIEQEQKEPQQPPALSSLTRLRKPNSVKSRGAGVGPELRFNINRVQRWACSKARVSKDRERVRFPAVISQLCELGKAPSPFCASVSSTVIRDKSTYLIDWYED